MPISYTKLTLPDELSMKLSLTLATFLISILLFSCGSSSSSPPSQDSFGHFLNLLSPGTLEIEDDLDVKETVFELTDDFSFDEGAMEVTILNSTSNYVLGDVFTFAQGENTLAVTVTETPLLQEGETLTYQVRVATVDEILDQSFHVALCPEFQNLSSSESSLTATGNNPVFDETNTIDLAGFELFNLQVKENGELDVLNSSIMGVSLTGNEESISEIDVVQAAGGYLRATVVSGSLSIIPTIDFQGEVTSTSYEISQKVDAHVKYDLKIRLESTGPASLRFEMPFFAPVSFIVTAGIVPLEVKLKVPAGFEFKSEGESAVDVSYSSEYAYQFTMDYDSATPTPPQFASQSDFFSDLQEMSEAGGSSIQGTLYLQPEVSVRVLGVFGPLVWIKPRITGILNLPLEENEKELFVGIEGGTGLVVSVPFVWEGNFRSEDLLETSDLSWDLLGPNSGSGNSNTPPIANNVWSTSNQGAATLISLEGTDPEQYTLFYTLQSLPGNGKLTILNTLTGNVTYTPNENFLGLDSFTYSVSDGYAESNIAIVTITVDDNSWSDNFEDGNSNGWITVDGNTEVSNEEAFNGKYSLHCWQDNGSWSYLQTIAKRENFLAAEGIYEAEFYVTGGVADGWLIFQQKDSDNYYIVFARPIGSDSPELSVEKVIAGTNTVLASVPANFSLHEWFKLTLKRFSNGDIEIYVEDQLQIQVNDFSIISPGSFSIGSWQNAYIDDVGFTQW